MWKIAVCDDDKQVHDDIARLLRQNVSAETYQLDCFTSGSVFLQSACTKQYDLVYLDIQMPEMNGMDVAKALRQQRCMAAIMFLTNFDDYLEIGYEVQAFRYRFKPLDPDIFAKDFCAWQAWYKVHGSPFIWIATATEVQQVAVQDIIYLEIERRKVKLVTKSATYISVEDMHYWEALLADKGFLAPYNKVLVNMDHVKSFDATKVVVTGDKELPMSRRKYQEFRKAMLQ